MGNELQIYIANSLFGEIGWQCIVESLYSTQRVSLLTQEKGKVLGRNFSVDCMFTTMS